MSSLWYTYPVVSFTILPLSLSFCLFFNIEPYSVSMHYIIFPLSNISITICKTFSTFTFNLSSSKLSFKPWLIRPYHNTLTIHIIIFKFPFKKFTSIRKVILPIPMKLPIHKIPFIIPPFKFKPTLPRLLPLHKIASILNFIIIPALRPKAMLLVIKPLPLIHTAISIHKDPIPISLTILPIPLVNVSIHMGHPPTPIVKEVLCLALVQTSIWELYYAKAFIDCHVAGSPLAFVLFRTSQIVILYFFENIYPYESFATTLWTHEAGELFICH